MSFRQLPRAFQSQPFYDTGSGMRHRLLTTFIILFTSGCEKTEQATSDINEPSAPIVGVLDTAGYQITLHTGAEGTRYTIHDPDGKILAKEITAGEFAQRFPKIHHEVRGVWAENFIKDRRRSGESPADDPGMEREFWKKGPVEIESDFDLPPLPDLRTPQQRPDGASDQLGK
jgi:hypothetical protein